MKEGRVPEFLNWLSYYKVLSDNTSKKTVKIKLLEALPNDFIISLEEIALNIRNYNIPLSTDIETDLLKNHKSVLKKLADKNLSLNKKRTLLKSNRGIKFLTGGLPKIISSLDNIITQNESRP